MDRAAVFVDAGYLFAAGGILLAGRRMSRGELQLDVDALEATLRSFAESESRLPLLRVYWYDGTDSGPTPDHTRLMWTQNVKVRLGIVNTFGQQKGVDSLLVSDIINLARGGSVATAFVLTGDEDIRVGVQQAQDAGLRVHLVGIAPARDNQSNMLQQEADVRHEWGRDMVARFLSARTPIDSLDVQLAPSASRSQVIHAVAEGLVAALDTQALADLQADFNAGVLNIPRDYDRTLIKALDEHVDAITEQDKRDMRAAFRDLVIAAGS